MSSLGSTQAPPARPLAEAGDAGLEVTLPPEAAAAIRRMAADTGYDLAGVVSVSIQLLEDVIGALKAGGNVTINHPTDPAKSVTFASL